MKNILLIILAIVAFSNVTTAQEIEPQEVKEIMEKVADWQIEHFRDLYSGHKKPHHPLDWTNGALYVGMVKWAAMADDNKYYGWLKNIGEDNEWQLYKRKYHADDHTVGQMYIELYLVFDEEEMIAPTMEQLEFIRMHPSQSVLNWKTPYHQDRWNWCDALFMSPPVWAKLYNINRRSKILGLYD